MTAMFVAAFAALAILNGLLALTAFTRLVTIWPVPRHGSWQSYAFWPLFRGGLGLTMIHGASRILAAPLDAPHVVTGVALALAALGVTVHAYFALGIENTYGADQGLVTTGLYRYSRNPQYVASIAGFAGLAIAAGTIETALLSALAIGVYGLMPFAEEPWLARTYGENYRAYARQTPRFLSLTKIMDRESLAR